MAVVQHRVSDLSGKPEAKPVKIQVGVRTWRIGLSLGELDVVIEQITALFPGKSEPKKPARRAARKPSAKNPASAAAAGGIQHDGWQEPARRKPAAKKPNGSKSATAKKPAGGSVDKSPRRHDRRRRLRLRELPRCYMRCYMDPMKGADERRLPPRKRARRDSNPQPTG